MSRKKIKKKIRKKADVDALKEIREVAQKNIRKVREAQDDLDAEVAEQLKNFGDIP